MPETKILPSGNQLVTSDTGERYIVFKGNGILFGTTMLPKNEFEKGTDEWANKEIEIYLLIKKYS